ncbi:MAG: 30S ribosomal protein S6 [Patescibacteria group bacterium]|nr:30S ribosomal protein S6 [Patescibacteria group bacterium]
MQPYELCVLFPGSIAPAEIETHSKQVAGLLAEAGAQVKVTHAIGRKKLAYTIAGQTHGEYVAWLFEAEPAAAQELDNKLRLSSQAVRHVITKLESVTIEERAQSLKDTKAGKSIASEEGEEESREKTEKPKPSPINAPQSVIESSEHKKTEKKASLEELDEKLDEILESDTL